MVDLALREHDEELSAAEEIDRLPDGAAITALAVHAEGAHALQREAVEPVVRAEDLPRRHEVEPAAGAARDVHHYVRIAVVTVVRRDEHAIARLELRERRFEPDGFDACEERHQRAFIVWVNFEERY